MKKLNVTVRCVTIYNGDIMIPDDFSDEDAYQYAREHIDEVPNDNVECEGDFELVVATIREDETDDSK